MLLKRTESASIRLAGGQRITFRSFCATRALQQRTECPISIICGAILVIWWYCMHTCSTGVMAILVVMPESIWTSASSLRRWMTRTWAVIALKLLFVFFDWNSSSFRRASRRQNQRSNAVLATNQVTIRRTKAVHCTHHTHQSNLMNPMRNNMYRVTQMKFILVFFFVFVQLVEHLFCIFHRNFSEWWGSNVNNDRLNKNKH